MHTEPANDTPVVDHHEHGDHDHGDQDHEAHSHGLGHVHEHEDGHGHGHSHAPISIGTVEERARQTKVLWFALAVNSVLLVAEAVGGFVFGSLALLADAAHMLSDVAGLVIALIAQTLMSKPNTRRHTFGLLRAEALGAQANAVMLLASTGWIIYEAVKRLGGDHHDIEGVPVLIIAVLGLVVNVVSAWALNRVRGQNLNVEGAYAHMMADALGSVGAIVAALAVVLFDVIWVDAVASALIAAIVLRSGWRLLKSTTVVLMEGAPAHLENDVISASILAMDDVEDVHHMHVWSLSTDTVALSAHVQLEGELRLHQAQEVGARIRTMLVDTYGIKHSTIELECHACDDQEHTVEQAAIDPHAGHNH